MKLEALFDAVIVKPLEEEETTYGSIVVPDLGKDRNEHGTVVAVGPGREVAGIGFVETIVKEGDVVRQRVGQPHQLFALTDGVIFEVSTEHFDEDSYRVWKGDSQNESMD